MDGAVQHPVTTPVEAVADGAAAAGFEWAGAGQGDEGGVVSASSGWEKLTITWAALTGPMSCWLVRGGSQIVHDGPQLRAVGLERAGALRSARAESPDLGLPHGLARAWPRDVLGKPMIVVLRPRQDSNLRPSD